MAHVYFSIKLEKRAEQVLPESEGVGGIAAGGTNGPYNVCIDE
jgi:hypothetical protein